VPVEVMGSPADCRSPQRHVKTSSYHHSKAGM
jgi:hypothetical protein